MIAGVVERETGERNYEERGLMAFRREPAAERGAGPALRYCVAAI